VTKTRVSSNLTAIMWTDKQNVKILTNMHFPPADGNFCDKHGNVPELAIAEDCKDTWKCSRTGHSRRL